LFHKACFVKTDCQGSICSRCKLDDEGIELNESLHVDMLGCVYRDYYDEPDFKKNITLLSSIIQTIDFLVGYDFGDLFANPVDLIAYPEYGKRITRPMDLGTVRTSILYGSYCVKMCSSQGSMMDCVVLESLKDIETVWFNCLSFNVEGKTIINSTHFCMYILIVIYAVQYLILGSVVMRAGQLQQRKYKAIFMSSIKHNISLQVTEKLLSFRTSCEQFLSKQHESKHRRLLPISNHFINVKTPKKSRVVAVWDPETSMIVKFYTSVKNAFAAYNCLVNFGHSPGFIQTDLKSFTQFIECPITSDKFLFGYKWVLMDHLLYWQKKLKEPAASHDRNRMVSRPFVPKGFTENSKYFKIQKVAEKEQLLECFDCIEKVTADWYESYKLSLRSTENLGGDIRDIFASKYLDYERDIDGIFWRSASNDQRVGLKVPSTSDVDSGSIAHPTVCDIVSEATVPDSIPLESQNPDLD
jgi:hypothetical protein